MDSIIDIFREYYKIFRSILFTDRSSGPEVFYKKGVLRNFAKFTGKHLCQSLFLNKVPGLGPATLLIKRLWHWCFSRSYVKLLRTPFLKEHLLLAASIQNTSRQLLVFRNFKKYHKKEECWVPTFSTIVVSKVPKNMTL